MPGRAPWRISAGGGSGAESSDKWLGGCDRPQLALTPDSQMDGSTASALGAVGALMLVLWWVEMCARYDKKNKIPSPAACDQSPRESPEAGM